MEIDICRRCALTGFVLLAILGAGCGAGVSPFEKEVELTRPGEREPAYVYVPFEVPEGAKNVSVVLEYDASDGQNRLEMGVFDERFGGGHKDKSGFRGWSGSVRNGFFVSAEKATHGYQKGPVNPGTWHVVLGLASLESDTLKAKLKVSFQSVPPELLSAYNEEKAREFKHQKRSDSAGTDWARGDLHSHSFHSDGSWSIRGLLESAEANDLDFISVTEHNTYSHHTEIDSLSAEFPGLLVLKGQEITTYGGHINAWGLRTGDWIDFRVLPGTPRSADRILEEARSLGALVSVNHPTMDCTGCRWTYGDMSRMDSIEVWNAAWDDQDESALAKWDTLLQRGNKLTAVGSSDTHQPPYEPSDYPTNLAAGSPTLFVRKSGPLTKKSLFEAIKLGRVYVAEDPAKEVDFSVEKGVFPGGYANPDPEGNLEYSVRLKGFRKGSSIKVIWKLEGGKTGRHTRRMRSSEMKIGNSISVSGPGYIRLEVRNPDGSMAAFTNPIWIKDEATKDL